MDPNQQTQFELQLARMEGTIDQMHKDIRRMKLYAAITFWGGVLVFVVPLLLLPFFLSTFFSTYVNSLGGATAPTTQTTGNSGLNGTGISNADLQNALNSLGL